MTKSKHWRSPPDQADELELLSNLWTLVATVVAYGKLDVATAKIEPRTVTLKSELARLAGDEKRPNNALYARTLSTFDGSALASSLGSATN